MKPNLMDSLKHKWREIKDVTEEQRIKDLMFLATTFADEWLRDTRDHLLSRPWTGYDRLDGLELLILSYAMQEMKRHSEPATYDHLVREIKTLRDGQLRGALWEVICGGLLSGANRVCTLATANQAGYDLVVSLEGQPRYLVSCKSLNASDVSETFQKAFGVLHGSFRQSLKRARPVSVIFLVEGDMINQLSQLKKSAAKAARACSYIEHRPASFRAHHCSVRVSPLGSLHGLPFAGMGPNYLIHFVAEQGMSEQRRFARKLAEANGKFDKIDMREWPTVTQRIAALRVPREVLMSSAIEYVKREWKSQYPLIDHVILVRATVAHEIGQADGRQLIFEYRLLHRPGTDHKDAGRVAAELHIRPPFGAVTSRELLESLQLEDGRSIDLSKYYYGLAGSLFYARPPIVDKPIGRPIMPGVHINMLEQVVPGIGCLALPLQPDKMSTDIL